MLQKRISIKMESLSIYELVFLQLFF